MATLALRAVLDMRALRARCFLLVLLVMGAACTRPASEPPLMSYSDYPRVEHPVPYILRCESSHGALLYYGARHTFDPADAQVAEIQSLWNSFHPTLALNEGGSPPAEASPQAAMRYGEAGLVRFLAKRDGVHVDSLEPSREVEFGRALDAGYAPTTVKIFWALRFYVSFRRANPQASADEFMSKALNQNTGHAALDGEPTTVTDLTRLYAALFPEQPDWRTVPDEYFDPGATATVLNRISRDVSIARDEHMIRLLVESVIRGERVFAVVGASHVVVQHRKLRHHLQALAAVSSAASGP